MHILLTRQLQDSKDLIQKFKSNGFKVSNLPLLEINKLDKNEITDKERYLLSYKLETLRNINQ